MADEHLVDVERGQGRESDPLLGLGRPRPRKAPPPSLFEVEGVHCEGCRLREPCGAMTTRHACRPDAIDVASVPFSPLHVDVVDRLAEVGGAEISTMALPLPIPALPGFIPQIRFRADTKLGRRSMIAIRIDQVLLARGQFHSAAAIRKHAGLHPGQPLMLLGFAEDSILERLWVAKGAAGAIADAGFDVVVAPSYSLWHERPRPWHLHSHKRSFAIYEELQAAGVPVLPRVGFVVERDAERLASWCNANPSVDVVAVDLMTFKDRRSWLEHADLMVAFDDATDRRLRFLVNGTTSPRRLVYLFEAFGDRLHLTDAKAVATAPSGVQTGFAEAATVSTRSSLAERIAQTERTIDTARLVAGLDGVRDEHLIAA